MKIVSRTDVGLVRASNQDALLICGGEHGLYGVADGMGGHQAGDVASSMTVLMLSRILEGAQPSEGTLRAGIDEVNSMVYREQKKDDTLRGMGTTLTLIWEDTDSVFLAHIGDSRGYLWRDGCLKQMTQDHSMVEEMVRNGTLTPEQAKRHPYRNVITRAVGTDQKVSADILRVDKTPGDLWLICSDGLTEYVTDKEIAHFLSGPSREEAADGMLHAALDRGGRDNVTLLIAEVAK